MQLTVHGLERILGRTQMTVQDVLEIIKRGAVIKLGESNDKEFLLFYSRLDRDVKIALVASQRTILVSIWEWHFNLPDGVRCLMSEDFEEARRLYVEAFSTITMNGDQPHGKEIIDITDDNGYREIVLEIRARHKNNTLEFRTVLGTCPLDTLHDIRKLVDLFEDNLRTAVYTIDAYESENAAQYDYYLIAHRPHTQRVKFFRIPHDILQRYLLEAG